MNLTPLSFAGSLVNTSLSNWPDLVDRLGWVLVHSLWQFTLAALVLGLALRFLSRASSQVRYATCLAAMAIILILPAATWFRLWNDAPANVKAANDDSPGIKGELGHAPLSHPVLSSHGERPQVEIAAAPNGSNTAAHPPSYSGGLRPWQRRLEPWLPAIVAAWLMGIGAFSLRPLLSWWTIRNLRTTGTSSVSGSLGQLFDTTRAKLGLRRSARLLQSGRVTVPMVAGYFRPIVLIPLAAASGLPTEQLEALFAHELAHIRRHDYLVNLFQTAVETLFFYHPATWWISFQIRAAREECCDDTALSVCGKRSDYAQALVSLEELRSRIPATALAADGGTLLARIRRIAGIESEPAPGLGSLSATAAVLGVLLTAAVMSAGPVRSEEQGDRPAAPTAASDRLADKPAAANDAPFRVTLPDGAVFELIGVNDFADAGTTWWRPDGSPLTRAPAGRGSMNFSKSAIPRSLVRDFALETRVPESGRASWPTVQDADGLSSSSKEVNRNEHQNLVHTVAQLRPTSKTTVTVTYAGGPWETVSEFDGHGPMAMSSQKGSVAWDKAWEDNGAARVVTTFDVADSRVRIVAVDAEGREHLNSSEGSVSARGAQLFIVRFPNLPLARVSQFRFQKCPLHRIEFRNVSLYPGQRSRVEIFVDGKSDTAATAQGGDAANGATPVSAVYRRYTLIIARQAMLLQTKVTQNAVLTDWKLIKLDRLERLLTGEGPRPIEVNANFTNGSFSQLDSLQKRFVKWHEHHGINVSLTFIGANGSQRFDAIRAAGDLIPDRGLRCEGTVRLGDGRPVADAVVVMRQASESPTSIYLDRGTLRDRLDEAWTTTDAHGRFVFFPQDDNFAVAALHPQGIATATGIELRSGRPLLLKSWARIDLIGDGEAALFASRTGKLKGSVHLDFQVFPSLRSGILVPPGPVSVQRFLQNKFYNNRTVETASGRTTTVSVEPPAIKFDK